MSPTLSSYHGIVAFEARGFLSLEDGKAYGDQR